MADQRVMAALELLQEQVAEKEAEVIGLKQAANTIAKQGGVDAPYDLTEIAPKKGGSSMNIRSDQFANFGAPSTAARGYLEFRGQSRGAATVDEIYEALVKGGYSFEQQQGEPAKNGLKIALAKDTNIARLQNGTFGLSFWYPNLIEKKKTTKGAKPTEPGTREAVTPPFEDLPERGKDNGNS